MAGGGWRGRVTWHLALGTCHVAFDCQNLLDDFVRGEIAFPAVKAAGAKFAAVGAANLGGNAERMGSLMSP